MKINSKSCSNCGRACNQLRRGYCINCYRKITGLSKTKYRSETEKKDYEIKTLKKQLTTAERIINKLQRENEKLRAERCGGLAL